MPSHSTPIGSQTQLSAIEFAAILRDPAAYTAKIEELTRLIEEASKASDTARQIIEDATGEAIALRAKALDDIAANNDEFNEKIAKVQAEWERKALELDRREASLKAEEDEMAKQLASSKAAEDDYLVANQEAQKAKLEAAARHAELQKTLSDIKTKVQTFISSLS